MKETGIHENNLSRVAKMYGLYGFFICTKNCIREYVPEMVSHKKNFTVGLFGTEGTIFV